MLSTVALVMPWAFMASRSLVIPSLVMSPSIQCHQVAVWFSLEGALKPVGDRVGCAVTPTPETRRAENAVAIVFAVNFIVAAFFIKGGLQPHKPQVTSKIIYSRILLLWQAISVGHIPL